MAFFYFRKRSTIVQDFLLLLKIFPWRLSSYGFCDLRCQLFGERW